jgi:hypothetical protein
MYAFGWIAAFLIPIEQTFLFVPFRLVCRFVTACLSTFKSRKTPVSTENIDVSTFPPKSFFLDEFYEVEPGSKLGRQAVDSSIRKAGEAQHPSSR